MKKHILKKILIGVLIFQFWFTSLPVQIFAQEEPTTTPFEASPTPSPFEDIAPTSASEPTPTIEDTPTPTPTENPPSNDSDLLNLDEPMPSISDTATFADSSAEIKEPIKVMPLRKKNFRADEKITLVVVNTLSSNVKVSVFNVDGVEVNIEKELVSDYGPTVIRLVPPSQFKAGRYRLKVVDPEGNVSTQDFTWGVLAINTNKSIYLPSETAKLAMAVLDERGLMVCDALIRLEIKNPKSEVQVLTTENGEIVVNPDCEVKDFTENPDYAATYKVGEAGAYQMSLTAETKNGIYNIVDSFEVRESVPFDVERLTTTRVFPPVTYPVVFDIVAGQDFEGEVKETVPASFAVTQLEGVQGFEKVEAVLSASTEILEEPIFGLVPPFDEAHPVSLGFGEQLRDPVLVQKYSDFGLIGHDGIDFDMPEGIPVLAVDDGEVVRVDANGDYGATVVIEHSWGKSYYGHLSRITTDEGKKIEKGHPLGMSGSTGISTGPHLHFGIKPNDNDPNNGYYGKINPLPYLNIIDGNQNVLGRTIENSQESGSSSSSGMQIITWKVSVKKDERIKLGYNFKAPNISPQFFLLGPLEFEDNDGKIIFQEARRWQLAIDADGSGANTVAPTTGTVSSSGNTYTFTFDPSEVMDSGGITITVPTSGSPNWSDPQGSAGTDGYTVAAGTGAATVGDVLINADAEDPSSPAGIWQEFDNDMCGNNTTLNAAGDIVVDTTNKKEGTGSIECTTSPNPDNGDAWGFLYDANQNWSTFCSGGGCTDVGYWARASVNTEATEFSLSSGTNLGANRLDPNCALTITTADTWEYKTCDISGLTLTTVRSYGFVCTNATCNPVETGNLWVDEFLIGPGVATFSGAGPWDITVRFLDLAAANTVTVTYGSGGGSSGVQNSSTEGVHTFTTKSKVDTAGTLTNISSHPTITLSSGPTMDQVMRHGKWFNGTSEQPFTF